jgi:acetyl-CoA carboxylase biotin carboxyl carrier protein
MIDLRYIKKLIDMLDGSSVDSVEISSDKGMKLRISKSPQQRGTVQMAAPMQMASMMSPNAGRMTPSDGMPALAEGEAAPKVEAPKTKLLEVTSPMVGTFYGAPEPGAKPYVSVGSSITKGQILCIIEAMKIMNEIESDFTGVIKEVVAQDAHPVEYGQVLFRVDPNG